MWQPHGLDCHVAAAWAGLPPGTHLGSVAPTFPTSIRMRSPGASLGTGHGVYEMGLNARRLCGGRDEPSWLGRWLASEGAGGQAPPALLAPYNPPPLSHGFPTTDSRPSLRPLTFLSTSGLTPWGASKSVPVAGSSNTWPLSNRSLGGGRSTHAPTAAAASSGTAIAAAKLASTAAAQSASKQTFGGWNARGSARGGAGAALRRRPAMSAQRPAAPAGRAAKAGAGPRPRRWHAQGADVQSRRARGGARAVARADVADTGRPASSAHI
jgi:hypothetical protein